MSSSSYGAVYFPPTENLPTFDVLVFRNAQDVTPYATNAGNVNITNTTSGTTYYPTFVDASSGYENIRTNDPSYTYNATTNTISANTSGTASTAVTASNIALTSDDTSGSYWIPFSKTNSATSNTLYIDDTTTTLSYNPFTSTLSANNFNGNASMATTATNIAGGAGGSIPYQSATSTTALLANGTAGQLLQSNGTTLAPSWITPTVVGTPNLSAVLVAGNSAGSTSINMNSQDITSANQITATQFNGALNGNASTATTASACSGNSATATLAATATNALACSGNSATATTATNVNLSSTVSGTTYLVMSSVTGSSTADLYTDNGGASYDTATNTADINITSNAGTATTALACSGNSATATLAATATNALACSGNSATATTASACSGNSATATTATNIDGGLGGSIPYQSALSTTALLANGTAGQLLQSNGTTLAPSWITPTVVGTPNLSAVLVAGNSAGSTSINMNSQDITSANQITATQFNGALNGNASTATTASACSGNSATATLAATATNALACSGNSATATTASACSGNSATATTATNVNLSATATGNPYYLVMSATQSGTSALLTDNLGATYDSTTNTADINITANAGTATTALACSGNSATATLAATATNALACSGNSATATTASACSGNSATATTASACSGNSATATTATNIAGGLGGSIPYQSALSTTALLANGTAGQLLQSNGTTLAPSWINPAVVSTPNLSAVLVAGNSAGSTSINMNNNAISSVSTLGVSSTATFSGQAVFQQNINLDNLLSPGTTQCQIFVTSGVVNYDATATSSNHYFAVRDSGGISRNPLQITAAGLNVTYGNIVMFSNSITGANQITATQFNGPLNGNASSASKVNLSSTVSGTTYLVMSSVTSSSTADLFTDNGGASYDTATNTADINITSNAGSATKVAITNTTTGTTYYPTFVDANTGNEDVRTKSATLTYNADTNTLASTNFTGTLSGTSSSTNAINTTSMGTTGTYYFPYVTSATGTTNQTPYADGNISFDRTNNTLNIPNLSMAGSILSTVTITNGTSNLITTGNTVNLTIRTQATTGGSVLIAPRGTTALTLTQTDFSSPFNNMTLSASISDNLRIGYGSSAAGNNLMMGKNVPYTTSFITNTGLNTIIGNGSGTDMVNGAFYNTLVGDKSGGGLKTGTLNTFVGMSAGFQSSGTGGTGAGSYNTAVGAFAGQTILNSASNNCFLGTSAGRYMLDQSYNTCLGSDSGTQIASNNNTFVGGIAGPQNAGNKLTGTNNVAVGYKAGTEMVGAAANNTFVGTEAGEGLTTGIQSTFIGGLSGFQTGAAGTGSYNTCVGYASGTAMIGAATENTLIGTGSGIGITIGNSNTFVGTNAGFQTTTATENSFFGKNAGFGNTTGLYNTFIGFGTGFQSGAAGNTESNTCVGYRSGAAMIGGARQNTFVGVNSGNALTFGIGHTIIGYNAGIGTTSAAYNVFIGNESGNQNPASPGTNGLNVCVGYQSGTALTGVGSLNTFIGGNAGDIVTTGQNNICIGYNSDPPSATISNTINIGTATETMYIKGGLNFKIGATITNTTNGNLSTAGTVLAQYYNVTMSAASQTITLPAPSNAAYLGAMVTFKRKTNTTQYSIAFFSGGVVYLPVGSATLIAGPITIAPSIFQITLVCDGSSWNSISQQ